MFMEGQTQCNIICNLQIKTRGYSITLTVDELDFLLMVTITLTVDELDFLLMVAICENVSDIFKTF